MKNPFIAIVLSSCFLFACSNSNDSAKSESGTMTDSSLQQVAPSTADVPVQEPADQNSDVTTVPASKTEAQPLQQQLLQQQPAATTAAGMNPPHGQPGHRCELAVGAPLNSSPSTTTTPATQAVTPAISQEPVKFTAPGSTPAVNLTPVPPPVTATPVKTAPGMNPPHGEPGHDCSIAVGAPLKK